jgi:hypothetical protein
MGSRSTQGDEEMTKKRKAPKKKTPPRKANGQFRKRKKK